jgi:hypothetical protein
MSLHVDARLDEGIRKIRSELGVPTGFPPAAAMEAVVAANAEPGADHIDRTDRPFVTLDPAEAIDLDQAFTIERSGGDLILHYAIADVGWFVEPDSSLNEEAWKRGVTVYLPDQKSRLYPAALSEGAASLLPDGPRPAVVLTTRVDGTGEVRLEGAERAIVHSRAKLTYDTVAPDDLPDGFGGERLHVGTAETQAVRVLDVPARGPAGELGAADAEGPRRIVDLVVDVGDVLGELHGVPAALEPALEPHRQHEGARIADVDALVHRRPTEVHADRARRGREIVLPPRLRVVEPDRHRWELVTS